MHGGEWAEELQGAHIEAGGKSRRQLHYQKAFPSIDFLNYTIYSSGVELLSVLFELLSMCLTFSFYMVGLSWEGSGSRGTSTSGCCCPSIAWA